MRYKLLALDLDGTALGSDPDLFSPGLAEAAAEAAAKGCIVAVATGRPAKCLPAALDPVPGWLQWLVLCDGAEVRNAQTNACLWRRAFSAASLAQVEAAARMYDIPAEYVDCDSRYHMTAVTRHRIETSGLGAFHKGVVARQGCLLDAPAASLAGQEVLKVNMPFVPQEVRPGFAAAVKDAALIMDCGSGGLELTAPGAGKLSAVQFLAQTLGFSIQDDGAGGQRQRRCTVGGCRSGRGYGQRPGGGHRRCPRRDRAQHRRRRGRCDPPLAAGRNPIDKDNIGTQKGLLQKNSAAGPMLNIIMK